MCVDIEQSGIDLVVIKVAIFVLLWMYVVVKSNIS